jgi:hypothetical protein
VADSEDGLEILHFVVTESTTISGHSTWLLWVGVAAVVGLWGWTHKRVNSGNYLK